MQTYIAMINMAGYLPDSEPVDFESYDEARSYLIEQLKSHHEERSEYEPSEKLDMAFSDCMEDLTSNGCGYYLGYYYGVNEV